MESQRRCPYCGSLLEMRNNNNGSNGYSQPMQVNNYITNIGDSKAGTEPAQAEQPQIIQTQDDQVNAGREGMNQVLDNQAQGDQPVVNQAQVSRPSYQPQVNQPQANQPQFSQYQYGQAQAGQMQQNRLYANWGQQAPIKQRTMSNGLKVFLTVLFVIIPGIGQLAGAITAIIMMNSDTDNDKRSFGTALLVASLLVFLLTCTISFVIALAIPMLQ